MLDAETRRLIAPRLAEFHEAAGDLDVSRRQLAETVEELARHRAAGGVFGQAAKRLRDLRQDQRKLISAVARQERYAESLAAQIDVVLHPLLRVRDGHYQRLVATTVLFGEAAGHCDAVGTHLAAAFGTGRTVTKAVMGQHIGQSEQVQAGLAAQRFGDHLRAAEDAMKALPDQLTEIEGWVEALIRGKLPPVPMPDLSLFDRLPRNLETTAARLRLAQTLGALRTLQAQIQTTATALRQWRDLADRKRRAALRSAYRNP